MACQLFCARLLFFDHACVVCVRLMIFEVFGFVRLEIRYTTNDCSTNIRDEEDKRGCATNCLRKSKMTPNATIMGKQMLNRLSFSCLKSYSERHNWFHAMATYICHLHLNLCIICILEYQNWSKCAQLHTLRWRGCERVRTSQSHNENQWALCEIAYCEHAIRHSQQLKSVIRPWVAC